ncbi:D-lyxose/D-mannose family sugar isomerase [Pseudooceanicola sediminis]|uniref:D-lyxose ketol-isomerase n=1 Tax=Pseudooceanicola sediminis TaxID=2211117 RepID=A0A399IYZ4_9RHOB|nr:D-lyxose/D-mannose family sugar isomerase [Pseudooceanicola sediminis]KAA2313345.1 D-lyxose/D-mannose family sugar isomerase [Puniceibacterium sp. HSS470]RII38373.1 D-lyxose/D-mannose family sugar isomerase [Pseudooceanicola sediminis]|tara:strand:+ start:60713 stop:61399 length:687 start_codon:yes stop_codon:yes gene_type:complete
MLRSDINELIREGDAFFRQHGFVMPPFAYWSPAEMRDRKADAALILDAGLGWDVTDYGNGDYDALGLFLFTLRNGDASDLGKAGGGRVYAEKLLISAQDQISPMHRHIVKTEDIINRGGGVLVLELFKAAPDGSIDREAEFDVMTDGLWRRMSAGGLLALHPGESVTLTPDVWHAFWGDGGRVCIGEVSTVNDDRTDNIFEAPIGRFSSVDEDEEALHLLVSDYDTLV